MKDEVKDLSETILSVACDFIGEHSEDDAYFIDRLKDYSGEQEEGLFHVPELISKDALEHAILEAFDFKRIAEQFIQAVHECRPELLEILAGPEYAAHTPEEWLSMSYSDLYRDDDFMKALASAVAQKRPALGFGNRHTAKTADRLVYPLDKINSKVWGLLESADKDGQISFDVLTGKRGKAQKDVLVMFSINFEECKISKKLTQYDKRVYVACDALYKAGNEYCTPSQIYRMLGNNSSPSIRERKRINDSITKMGDAKIFVDNARERAAGYNYPDFVYDGKLLPFERVTGYVNNVYSDSLIHFFRRPPLGQYAEDRKQVTTISRALLESPISKTEKNLAIEDYLIDRIGHMKRPGRTERKILLRTLYDSCGISEKKDRQRTREKVKILLEHYKNCKWIKDFTLDGTAAQITV